MYGSCITADIRKFLGGSVLISDLWKRVVFALLRTLRALKVSLYPQLAQLSKNVTDGASSHCFFTSSEGAGSHVLHCLISNG